MSVIALSHITKDYGGGHGVFDVSFAVEQGEVFGFLGPNGAGKTTTIRQLMGFLAPDSGTCTINGLDCRTQTAAIQKNMGYIPGEPALPDDMRGGEFIRFLAAYRGMRGTGRAGELCERFELDASGRIRRMSKGMKQKVAIVCALMHDPAVLILSRSFFADSSYMLSFSVLCSCVCSRLISPSVSSWHKQDNTLMHQSPGHIQRRTPYNF